ncbi:MAG: NFACT family protein [Nanoarchaeota archaeon]
MKTQLSGFDIHALVLELQELKSSRITKIIQHEASFLFECYKTGSQALYFSIILPNWAYLGQTKNITSIRPPQFCQYLRKHIKSGKILSIQQVESERIIKIGISTKQERYTLVIELFSKGNMILTNHKNMICSVLTTQTFKDRMLKQGVEYQYPPPAKHSDFNHLITNTYETISRALAIDFGYGGGWAEEICVRAKINPQQKNINKEDVEHIKKVIDEIDHALPEPWLVFSKDQVVDVTPIRFYKYANAPMQRLKLFSEGIAILHNLSKEQKTSKLDSKINAISTIIDKQEEHHKELESQIYENTKTAEQLYNNYQGVKSLLNNLSEARKSMSWKEIKQKIKNKHIISIDESKGTIVINL